MKKLKKLKLNEMQDFTAIEKEEAKALKGGWLRDQSTWFDLAVFCGYRASSYESISYLGSYNNGSKTYYAGMKITQLYGSETFHMGDVAGVISPSAARDSHILWEKNSSSNTWMSTALTANVYTAGVAEGNTLATTTGSWT